MAFAILPELTQELNKWGLETTHIETIRLVCEQKDISKVTKVTLASSMLKVMSGLNANFKGICKFLEAVSPKKKTSNEEFFDATDEGASTSQNEEKTTQAVPLAATQAANRAGSAATAGETSVVPAATSSKSSAANSGKNSGDPSGEKK